jgi:hypothetical protein
MPHSPVHGALQLNILQSTRNQGRVAIRRKIFRKTRNVYRKRISAYRNIFLIGEARNGVFPTTGKTDESLSLVSQKRSVSRWQAGVQP